MVRSSGELNFYNCKLPLPQPLNIPLWRTELQGYNDNVIVDYLEFGWPVGYTAPQLPAHNSTNHHSALAFPEHVTNYIQTELDHGAMLGPFTTPPFKYFHLSPLMTRPKKDSEDRRVIVDLSFPHGTSVNDGIPKDEYLGKCYKLQYPGIDTLVSYIMEKGQGCHIFKIDLARAYRHFRADVSNYCMFMIEWERKFYIDTSIPFGLRTGAMICQRVTNALAYILSQRGINICNYIDDLAGCNYPGQATKDYIMAREVTRELGLQEAPHKLCPPSTNMIFLGVLFDTLKLTLQIPQDKVAETLALLQQWRSRSSATRHQLQSLLGKLHHISKCVRPARLFVSRMLETLRLAPKSGHVALGEEFMKDVHWFLNFMPTYNGINVMHYANLEHTTGHSVHLDACLTGCGGIYGQECYAAVFPHSVMHTKPPIHHLEMLNAVVAARLWGSQWAHSTVILHLDNMACVFVLSSGRSRDPFLLQCAREMWLCSVQHDFIIFPQHVPGKENQLSDSLSRLHLSPDYYHEKIRMIAPPGLIYRDITPRMFSLTTNV